jgi:sporulation protein YlmC with PRC-barrel domain
MDIPTNVDVLCQDRVCGHSTYIVLNPVANEITHIVVKQNKYPYADRLVPVGLIVESTPSQIHLSCSEDELATMEKFIEYEFIGPTASQPYYMLWPYDYPALELVTLEHEHVPADELAVRRGAHVEATDGQVGRVDEFLIDPQNGHITHLVMRKGHLWGQRDVTIPVSQISHIEEDVVHLKLDKASIEALPTIPIRGR